MGVQVLPLFVSVRSFCFFSLQVVSLSVSVSLLTSLYPPPLIPPFMTNITCTVFGVHTAFNSQFIVLVLFFFIRITQTKKLARAEILCDDYLFAHAPFWDPFCLCIPASPGDSRKWTVPGATRGAFCPSHSCVSQKHDFHCFARDLMVGKMALM